MGKPEIRFKGYTDEWEQRKLGEVTQCLDSERVPINSEERKKIPGEIPYYGAGNIQGYINKFLFDEELVLLLEDGDAFDDFRTKEIAQYICGKTWVNNHAHVLRPLGDAYFLYITLSHKDIRNWVQLAGASRKKLVQKSMLNIELFMPHIIEQKKIGQYFSNLDHLITLHQRKCEQTKNLKKYMLQKMFPQNGAKVPEIRFNGFTHDWEQRKLGDIYGSIGNAFVGTATPYYAEHGHFYLESNNVKDGQINHNAEIFINDEFYEKQKDKWLHTGDMVMVQSGHVGHAAVIPEELDNTAAHALIMFRNPKEEIEPYFLNYEYQTDKAKKQIENITTGNTIKHILASDMQEFVVDIPKYEEQKVIASYFCNLDNLITLHQRQTDFYKKISFYYISS